MECSLKKKDLVVGRIFSNKQTTQYTCNPPSPTSWSSTMFKFTFIKPFTRRWIESNMIGLGFLCYPPRKKQMETFQFILPSMIGMHPSESHKQGRIKAAILKNRNKKTDRWENICKETLQVFKILGQAMASVCSARRWKSFLVQVICI